MNADHARVLEEMAADAGDCPFSDACLAGAHALRQAEAQRRAAFEAGFHARPTPTQTAWEFSPLGINMASNAKQAYQAYLSSLPTGAPHQP